MKKLSKLFAVVLCLAMVLAMLPMTVSAATETCVEFTVDSLGLKSQNYTAGTNTVGGVGVEWVQLGNYGDGIQMRDSEKNGEWRTSMFWNTSAMGVGITKIELTYSTSKEVGYDNPDAVIFNFGNEAKGADYSTTLSTTKGVKTYTITPDADTYTYFYMEHDLGYTFYWDSIKVYYNGDGSETPDTPDTPVTPDDPTDPTDPDTPDTPVAGTITDGEYVIVCPAHNKALSSDKALKDDGTAGFYNAGVDVTVADGTVSGYGDAEKWVITNNADGSITISQNGQNLALGTSYSSMNLGEVNDKWVLEDAGDGLYYVKNVVRGNYIEWYNSMNNWSSYGNIASGSEGLFALKFYSVNASEPEDPDTPDTPDDPEVPGDAESSIANGEYVIYAPAYGMALSSTYNGYYNNGVAVTEGDVLSGYGDTEIWTVTNNADGSISISFGGKKLGMNDSYSSMPLDATNVNWVLEDAGDGLYYVKNVARGCYIEWYNQNSNWSGFAYINEGTEGMFALKFYSLNAEEPEEPDTPEDPETPDDPTDPTEPSEPSEPADATDPTVAPTEPASNGTSEEPKGTNPVIWVVIGVAVVAAAVVVVIILKKKA